MSNTTSVTSGTVDQSNQIKYIIMQTCYIPSIICSIFTLTNLLLNRNLRSTLHNHTSLILLVISSCDLLLSHPLTLNYLHLSHVVPSTNAMCLFWNFANSIFTVSTYWTMAWGSIERHLFIFHSTLFVSHRGRVLFHYIPLFIITCIYPVIANIIVILVYPCENQFNMVSLFCAFPCALKIQSVALYTRLAHNFIPTFIVASCTIGLIIRAIKQKRHVQNNNFRWSRYRQMILQLLSLASLFLILTLPATSVSIIQNCGLPNFAVTIQVSYFNFLTRFITIFMPFVCLGLLPEIWPKLFVCINNIQVKRITNSRGRVLPTR